MLAGLQCTHTHTSTDTHISCMHRRKANRDRIVQRHYKVTFWGIFCSHSVQFLNPSDALPDLSPDVEKRGCFGEDSTPEREALSLEVKG